MDEIWRKVVDTCRANGFWAAVSIIEGMGWPKSEAIEQVEGAMNIYGTSSSVPDQRRRKSASVSRSTAQGASAANRRRGY